VFPDEAVLDLAAFMEVIAPLTGGPGARAMPATSTGPGPPGSGAAAAAARTQARNARVLQQMRSFIGRDYLLPSASTFLEHLPYLLTIASAPNRPPQTVQQQQPPPPPFNRFAPTQPQQQQQSQPPWARPAAPSAASAPQHGYARGPLPVGTSAPRFAPPMPVVNLTPVLSPVQLLFLRQLSAYHERITPEQLSKEQSNSLEQLQVQIKRISVTSGSSNGFANGAAASSTSAWGFGTAAATGSRLGGPGPAAMSSLPVAEVIEEIEDIQEF